jgi:hypothetical protein
MTNWPARKSRAASSTPTNGSAGDWAGTAAKLSGEDKWVCRKELRPRRAAGKVYCRLPEGSNTFLGRRERQGLFVKGRSKGKSSIEGQDKDEKRQG